MNAVEIGFLIKLIRIKGIRPKSFPKYAQNRTVAELADALGWVPRRREFSYLIG